MIHLRGLGLRIMLDAKAVFFLSPAYKNEVFETYVPDTMQSELEAKTFIIPNGIDDFWFDNIPKNIKSTNSESSVIRLIFAGRVNKNKNVLLVQKARDILRKKRIETYFTVVGTAEDAMELKAILKYPNTKYIKAQSKESLINYYRENNIFIMPSKTESFGLVYAEAMSQGLPVVYTKGQGFDEQFPDGEVGYSVDCKDATSIANALEKITTNHFEYKKICVEKAKKFNWDIICKKYTNIYLNVIQGR